jgi:YggT family protein
MLIAAVDVVFMVFRIVQLLVFGAVIASWLGANPNNFIVRVLRETTEPIFRRVRPIARKIPGPVDWSPMIVLLGIELVERVLLHMVLR